MKSKTLIFLTCFLALVFSVNLIIPASASTYFYSIFQTQFDIWGVSYPPPKQYNIQFNPSWQLNTTQNLIPNLNPQFYLDIYNNWTSIANEQRLILCLSWTSSPKHTSLSYLSGGGSPVWTYTYSGDINTSCVYQIIANETGNKLTFNIWRNSTGTSILGASYTNTTTAMFSMKYYECFKLQTDSFIQGAVYLSASGIYTNYPPNIPVNPTLFQVFASFLTPVMVVGIVGYGFSQLGHRINENYGFSFFFIGGAVGLIICGVAGIISVWIVSLIFLLGGMAVFFALQGRGGD